MARILIVDDQRIPRVATSRTLEAAGYEILTEENGPDGITRAREHSPDLIVLDLHMPGMDGFEVVQRLKNDPVTESIPVIFLTGTASSDTALVRGLDLGAYDFLTKGCSKGELLARVGAMVRVKRTTDDLANAVAERSRFFASMSHELRTPINAIIGYNQLLEEGTYGPLEERQMEPLRRVSRSARHLLDLVNDILDISKIEAGKVEIRPEEVNLGALVRDTATSVQLQAEEKSIRLDIHAPDRLVVHTDPERVRQIVLNLLANAVKFTDDGEIVVTVARSDRDGTSGSPPNDSSEAWSTVEVTDTGPGVDPEDAERIFEEFAQGPGAAGTGLGLPISRRLADLLGGNLTLRSRPGEGATFTLRLPTRHRASTPAP